MKTLRMIIKSNIFFIAIILLAPQSFGQDASYALLSVSELEKLMGSEQNLVIVDLRSDDSYNKSHIPGAINIDRRQFGNDDAEVAGMMSTKEQTEKLLSEAGIMSSSHLVLYDDDSGYDCARFWFILKTYGHEKIQLLDGGYKKWTAASLEVSDQTPQLKPSTYSFPDGNSNYNATRSEVRDGTSSDNVIILDVRSEREYNDGHIPGAVNLEWVNNLDQDKFFKAKEDLIKQFEAIGVTPDKEIITYCRSGVRASHTAYVLREILGFKNVRIYDGSWIDWSHFKEEVEK